MMSEGVRDRSDEDAEQSDGSGDGEGEGGALQGGRHGGRRATAGRARVDGSAGQRVTTLHYKLLLTAIFFN